MDRTRTPPTLSRRPVAPSDRRHISDAFAIVIPAYNEARTIREVATGALRFGSEVIVVDDGSTDGTADQLRGMNVIVLRNRGNMGKAASLWRGFEMVFERGYAALITLDGDGQHDPADIPRLADSWRADPASIVVGVRQYDWRRCFSFRGLANRLADFSISWAAGRRIRDTQSGFRVYPLDLMGRVHVAHDRIHGFVFESEVLIAAARRGFRTTCTPISVTPREPGVHSHFRPVVDTFRITRMVWRSLCESRFSLRDLLRAFPRG